MSAVPGWSRTAGDIVAEIEMVQTNWSGPYLVVEGPSDECFFTSRIPSNVYIIQGGGRRNVEKALQIIDADPQHVPTVVVGVVDEDYDWLTGYKLVSPNVIKFDPRDLEGLLVRSHALDSVLAELGDKAMIAAFVAASGPVRDALAQRAEFFGRIRMYNAQHANVCLRKFKPQRFCDVRTWSYDHNAALSEAVRLGVHNDPVVLAQSISNIGVPTTWHAARGHDLVDILVGGLLGVLGTRKNTIAQDVEMLLRQSIPAAQLTASGFYKRLNAWQSARSCRVI